jgi:hypothetical protein
MKTKSRLLALSIAFAACVFGIRLATNCVDVGFVTANASAVPIPTPATAGGSGTVTTSGGLKVVTFDTKPGTVRVNLPDDIRPGDTVSGTLEVEPKGNTTETVDANMQELRKMEMRVGSREIEELPALKPDFTKLALLTPGVTREGLAETQNVSFTVPKDSRGFSMYVIDGVDNKEISSANIDVVADLILNPPSGGLPRFPLIGQQGRPVQIFGPFDGESSNTTLAARILNVTAVRTKVEDFEKNTENVSGGFGLIKPLAESPRKVVFIAPVNVTGPYTINVKDGDNVFTGNSRNIGVQLSAPKTNLMRGEKTVVTIEVSGLAGIIKEVPLQLDSKGVITMEGGSFQNLRIKPQEVSLDGRYRTNRTITGVQAGGFSVTATVIVGPFDLSLQDDTDPNRIFHFNSFTGDYVFLCGGGSCKGGGSTGSTGSPPTGSSVPPTPVNLTGIGKPAMKGCIITLSHNAPDRRVFARLDACAKTGEANVQTTSPKTGFNITDKNITDNTVSSLPPK